MYPVLDMIKMATSYGSYKLSDAEHLAADRVSSAMRYIFFVPDIYRLDIADGLKELLYNKNYDLNLIANSNAASLADELGIEKYVAQIVIDAAKKATTE